MISIVGGRLFGGRVGSVVSTPSQEEWCGWFESRDGLGDFFRGCQVLYTVVSLTHTLPVVKEPCGSANCSQWSKSGGRRGTLNLHSERVRFTSLPFFFRNHKKSFVFSFFFLYTVQVSSVKIVLCGLRAVQTTECSSCFHLSRVLLLSFVK